MNKTLVTLLFSSLLVSSLYANSDEHSKHHSSWSYEGATAPEHWGSLDEKFSACSNGFNQSPINLTEFMDADLPDIKFDYNLKATQILNNGHTIQVNVKGGSSIEVDNISFELKQFHFHIPSENNIKGKSFPLEAHLVHASADGKLAVVAVMFEVGESNKVLEKLWKDIPQNAGDSHEISFEDLDAILPKNRDYYRFNGSLTTPPCTEGVRWLVMKNSITLSAEQRDTFKKVMKIPNNRPIQDRNARVVID